MNPGSSVLSSRTLLLLVALGLLLPACKEHGEVSPGRVSYAMRHHEKSTGQQHGGPAGPGALISFDYPEVIGGVSPALRDSLNKTIQACLLYQPAAGSSSDGIDSIMRSFVADYTEFVAATPEYATNWFDRRQMHVVTDTAGLFCMSLEVETYQGGAHPNRLVRYLNLDVATGRRLEPPFGIARIDSLLARAERAFRSTRGVPFGASLQGSGFWFQDGAFAFPQNILITPRSMRFRYNDYEVAPYVMGPTEFEIPLEELRDIILPGSPIAALRR